MILKINPDDCAPTDFNKTGVLDIDRISTYSTRNLEEACNRFEQIFLKHMIDKIWDSALASNNSEIIEKTFYQDMLNEAIAKEIAEEINMGISNMMQSHICKEYFRLPETPSHKEE